mmetsp:Transcript_14249/g.11908  ORF Transcript_14249/g.11908 Transcript_14249/m.11908 type:complete len:87 (-) Transcript_14249:8-268(-)
MTVSVGYATYSGWVYVAYGKEWKGWLPIGALQIIIGHVDLCPFTRISNVMVYPEPEGEDDIEDEGDDSSSSSDDDKEEDDNSDDID